MLDIVLQNNDGGGLLLLTLNHPKAMSYMNFVITLYITLLSLPALKPRRFLCEAT